MVRHSTELAPLILLAATGLIIIAGATLDLYYAFLFQRRTSPLKLSAQPELRQRPFTLLHAAQVLFVSLLFAVPTLFQKPGAPTPSEGSLVMGPLVYALSGLLVASVCLCLTNTNMKEAFFSKTCGAGRAIGKGVVYGLASIPPVMLLSHVMALATETLGYESRLQEVFEWLNDGAVSFGTRMFMMFAAVVIAPVVEETLFRGILFPALLKHRSFASATLLTGAYFALVHFHAPSLLPLLALSIAFSSAYASTGSLLTPIVMHALFNTASILLYLGDTA